MKRKILHIHPQDNLIVALRDLEAGETAQLEQTAYTVCERIPGKHKFAAADLAPGDLLRMYGVPVGRATRPIPAGARITQENTEHYAEPIDPQRLPAAPAWAPPDVSRFAGRSFMGYRRRDGRTGTQNLWLVIPLVFCENRNLQVMRSHLEETLGFGRPKAYSLDLQQLIAMRRAGASAEELLEADILREGASAQPERVFPHVDGIRFLTHEGGCGGTRQDSAALCRLLAAYLAHPNVAGGTILSLGCQHAQQELLREALDALDPGFDKPLYWLEQQRSRSERQLIADAVKMTFAGLAQANEWRRAPAPLSGISLGLKCGGSDGFSGITANPALGYAADLLAALGGQTLLAEFPELHGVEAGLAARCVHPEDARRFLDLMDRYGRQALAAGSGFHANPSPGNIRDGLITDAMKSAGAARKGGTSPITGVLDYTEQAQRPGLHLLCTPGNDVEATTGMAGSGANVIVFTTGLGTPTGNAVAPTLKVSTNSDLARRMADLIDFDAGGMISGEATLAETGEALLELVIRTAGGDFTPAAVRLGQDDFIPWKRGVSL